MDVEKPVYGPETLISLHTNRPVSTTVPVKNTSIIFWCDACHLKLNLPGIAIQHMNGRSHKAKVNAKNNVTNQSNQGDVPKRKRGLDSSNVKPVGQVILEPVTKKSKGQTVKTVVQQPATKNKKEKPEVADPNLKCDDCNLVFDNIATAIPHFKGKKHVSAIAAKLAAKQIQSQKRGQRGGRGRGYVRGRGRGDGFGRGQRTFGGEAAAGELLRAMKNFYGNPFYTPQNAFSGKSQSNLESKERNVDDAQVIDDEYSHTNVESNDAIKDGPSKDIYNTHQVPPNYYDSQTFSRSSSNKYHNGYGGNTYYNPNESHYMNTNGKYSK